MPDLDSPSPQARRIAAIALGKRPGPGAVAALRAALANEDVAWVRPSIVLALGKIGGEEAQAALAEIEPRSESEAEALRKARDRVSGPATGFTWRNNGPVFASVPIGLEDVAIAEANGTLASSPAGLAASPPPDFGRPRIVRPGLIALPVRPKTLRCIYDVRILIAEGPERAFEETVRKAKVPWRDWINSNSDSLPYRFSLENVRTTKQE
ncbi:MAG: HEAT repeat domain-containing protein, partial [Thermoanaerobaculia bacterium]